MSPYRAYTSALWLLPEAAAMWAELDHEAGAVGQEFEPWRAVFGQRLAPVTETDS